MFLGLTLSVLVLQAPPGDGTPGGALNTYTQPEPDTQFTYRQPDGIGLYLQP